MLYKKRPVYGAENQFIVYATDSPSYLNSHLCYVHNYDIIHDMGFSYIHRCNIKEYSGSLIIISAGYAPLNNLNSDSPEIEMYGCLDMAYDAGNRFAERAISAMIDPDARITMLLYVSRIQSQEWLPTIRQAGFDIIETDNVNPRSDSKYAVCIGTGEMLSRYDWLDEVWGYDPFFLLAAKGKDGQIENDIANSALNNHDPENVILDLIDEIDGNSKTMNEVFGEQYLIAGLTDPDGRSFEIIRSNPDISMVKPLLSNIAKELDFSLFDASNLRERHEKSSVKSYFSKRSLFTADDLSERDENGYYFTDFEDWDKVYPLPSYWDRIV